MIRLALVVLLVLGFAPGPASAQEPGKVRDVAGKVHAVVILDTNSDLAPSLETSKETVRTFLHSGIGKDVLAETWIEGGEVTAGKVAARVNALAVAPADAVFCFFGGHGMVSEKDGRHGFQFTGNGPAAKEYVSRDSLRELLLAKKARLTVLISDSCGARTHMPLKDLSPADAIKPFGLPPARGAAPCFRKLFLDAAGVVDINSCYDGELAWEVGRQSVFTHALFKTFEKFKDRPDVSWVEFYEALKDANQGVFRAFRADYIRAHDADYPTADPEQNRLYDLLKKQERQTTQARYLPGTWLKVIAEPTDGTGVRVGEVMADSPVAARPGVSAGLAPGDVVVALDGTPTPTVAAMGGVIGALRARAAAGPVTATFRVRRGGELIDLALTLPKP